MATYQPIVTGYKPEGALGALYAGENAAMARQQTESANLADLFDAYQKQAAVQQAQFNLGESKYKAPNERAVSDLAGATALGQNNPDYLSGIRSGQLGQAQSLTATGAKDTALMPSSIEAGKAKNASEVASSNFTEAAKHVDTIASLAKQSPLMAASYINQNITDPDKKVEYLRLLQEGKIPKLQQQFALQSQEHLRKVDELNIQGRTSRDVAGINAASFANTAEKNLQAAKLGIDKLDLQSAEGTAKAALEAYKASSDELGKMIDQFKPAEKQSPRYLTLLKQQTDLRSKMIETANLIGTLRTPKSAIPGAPAPVGEVTISREELLAGPKPTKPIAAPVTTATTPIPLSQQQNSFEPKDQQEYRTIQNALLRGYTPVGRGNSVFGSGEIMFEDRSGNRIWSSQLNH